MLRGEKLHLDSVVSEKGLRTIVCLCIQPLVSWTSSSMLCLSPRLSRPAIPLDPLHISFKAFSFSDFSLSPFPPNSNSGADLHRNGRRASPPFSLLVHKLTSLPQQEQQISARKAPSALKRPSRHPPPLPQRRPALLFQQPASHRRGRALVIPTQRTPGYHPRQESGA